MRAGFEPMLGYCKAAKVYDPEARVIAIGEYQGCGENPSE